MKPNTWFDESTAGLFLLFVSLAVASLRKWSTWLKLSLQLKYLDYELNTSKETQ